MQINALQSSKFAGQFGAGFKVCRSKHADRFFCFCWTFLSFLLIWNEIIWHWYHSIEVYISNSYGQTTTVLFISGYLYQLQQNLLLCTEYSALQDGWQFVELRLKWVCIALNGNYGLNYYNKLLLLINSAKDLFKNNLETRIKLNCFFLCPMRQHYTRYTGFLQQKNPRDSRMHTLLVGILNSNFDACVAWSQVFIARLLQNAEGFIVTKKGKFHACSQNLNLCMCGLLLLFFLWL